MNSESSINNIADLMNTGSVKVLPAIHQTDAFSSETSSKSRKSSMILFTHENKEKKSINN
jgi:hypothetical protein